MFRIPFALIFLLQHGYLFPQNLSSTENITTTHKSVTEKDDRSDFVPRVVNGRLAKLGDIPYQLSFKYKHEQTYLSYCGGTLITPSKVVSAAHCFVVEEPAFFARCSGVVEPTAWILRITQVVAGNLQNEAKFEDGGQWRTIKSMNVPGRFKYPELDISVGFVTEPFELNDHVKTIPIASQHLDYQGNCLLSGYGRISHTVRNHPLNFLVDILK